MKVLVFILLTLTPLHKGLASSFSNRNTAVYSTLQRKLFVMINLILISVVRLDCILSGEILTDQNSVHNPAAQIVLGFCSTMSRTRFQLVKLCFFFIRRLVRRIINFAITFTRYLNLVENLLL